MSLNSEYPLWMYGLCLLMGVLYAFVLYGREKRFSEAKSWVRKILPVLRFLAVTLIAFFLLDPYLKFITRKIEKPILIFAQDNSESVALGKDSAYYRNEYKNAVYEFISLLSDKFDTNTYSFGDKIRYGLRFDFSDKETDIASLFDEIETRFSNRNVGAVIIASDGLYNKGRNPIYSSDRNQFPVFTVALGDTTVKKDLVLSKVLHNRIAYLGNKFPIELQVMARQLNGKNFTCTVWKNKDLLFSQPMYVIGNNFSVSIPVQLEAKDSGLQRYTVKLSEIEGEANHLNNVKDIYIDVLDSRQKILILADAPHPDVSAIKNAIEQNENYEVSSFLADGFSSSCAGYSLIIFHQLPSQKNNIQKFIADAERLQIPLLFVIGKQTLLSAFNNIQQALIISASGGKINDATPLFSKDFSLFTVSDDLKKISLQFAPLQVPFGNYKIETSSSVLFYQQIGMVETQQPLLLFAQSGERKTGVICGEGIWRWRLYDFFQNKNHNRFNELINKTVQYLSAKMNKSFFRVISKNSFYENEPVEFDAEVYNESYELINEPEVTLEIINAEQKKFRFVFSKTSNAYRLNAGVFPPGNYRYEAKVKVGSKIYAEKGDFSVTDLQIEATNTVADHQLLYSLAKKNGGEMFYLNEFIKLAEFLNGKKDIFPVSRSEKKFSDLVNLRWLFFLLLFLLSLEWFIRKINGSY